MGVGYDDDHSGEVYIRPVEVIPEKPKDKRNRDSKKRKEAKRRKAMLEAAARGERLKTAEEEAEQKQREQEQREAEAAAAAAAEEEAGTSTPGRQADDQDIEMTEEPSQQQQQQAGTPQQQQESMVNSPAPQQAGEEGTAKEGGAEPEKSAAEVAAVEGEVEVESDCRIIVNVRCFFSSLLTHQKPTPLSLSSLTYRSPPSTSGIASNGISPPLSLPRTLPSSFARTSA